MKTLKINPGALLFVLTGLQLFNFLDRYVLSSVLTPLKAELLLSDGQLGRISTAFMVGLFATAPVFGYLGDRYSRKLLLSVGIFIWSLATLLTGFCETYEQILLCRVFVGLGEASYTAISPSLISDSYGPIRRNNAITIYSAAVPIGSALGFILGGIMAAEWGWRSAFIWAGAPGLILCLSLLPFAEPIRGAFDSDEEKARSKSNVSWRDVFKVFESRTYRWAVLGYCVWNFAIGGYAFWGPTFLTRVHGIEPEKASTFFGAALVVAGVFGTLLGGFFASNWQKKNPAGYAWTLAWSTLVTVPFSLFAFYASNPTLAMIGMGLAMFFCFLANGPINTVILEAVPIYIRGSATALAVFLIHLLGDLWSPEIVGRISDQMGSLQTGVLVLPLAFLVGALAWFILAWIMKSESRRIQVKSDTQQGLVSHPTT